MTRDYRFLINQSSIDPVYQSMQIQFINLYEDCLDSLKLQFNQGIGCQDKEDYIKSFFGTSLIGNFFKSSYIDNNLFYNDFINEINKYSIDYLSIDIFSKETDCLNEFAECKGDPINKFVMIYYPIYLTIVLEQSLLIEIFYTIFANLSVKNMQSIEKALNRQIEENISNKIYKKYNIDKHNYVLSIKKIIPNKEDLIQVVKETNLFESNLSRLFKDKLEHEVYSKYAKPFNIFFHNASKYDIMGLFMNMFKEDLSYDNFILKVEVRTIDKLLKI